MSESKRSSVVLVHQRPRGEIEILLAGQLDISCVGRLRDAVLRASQNAQRQIAIDLSRVTAVDGVGLRTLVACRRLAAAVGLEMVLVRPSRPLFSRLSRTGLLRTLVVADPQPEVLDCTPTTKRSAERA